MKYFCCDERRREAVRGHAALNGIDFIEVSGSLESGARDFRQRRLVVHFLKDVGATELTKANIRLEGGERVRGIMVDGEVEAGIRTLSDVTPVPNARAITVTVDRRGDFSRYTLALVQPDGSSPLSRFDPQLASIDFSFRVGCQSEFDCQATRPCPPAVQEVPDLDYLAKDFASFRQLMLDRLSLQAPDWRERNAADLGVTLVELLAYVGDYLSYRQDAIATEAYLGTARSRVSVRRHTRLVDYPMHDGCNARAWVQVRLKADPDWASGIWLRRFAITGVSEGVGRWVDAVPLGISESERLRPTRFLTAVNATAALDEFEYLRVFGSESPEVFEPLESALLFPQHNEIRFHTWGNEQCCLPRGATRATLRDSVIGDKAARSLCLRKGDVLVFIERVGPKTGLPRDADARRRHAVRLTRVFPEAEPTSKEGQLIGRTPNAATGDLGRDPLTEENVVEIEWAEADALPFALTLSSRLGGAGPSISDVSVACGNIVLTDHGRTLTELEALPPVPLPSEILASAAPACGKACEPEPPRMTPARYRPALREGPVTQAAPFDRLRPARDAAFWNVADVFPAIQLVDEDGQPWLPQRDLLSSDFSAREFVVEVENDGSARLRFGDDENGARPGAGIRIAARYRIGNGPSGNVAAGSISHLVGAGLQGSEATIDLADAVDGVTNLLPGWGGQDPETLEHARNSAPSAFRVQERAVTPDDYARKAELHPEVQQAVATCRWTGSWHTIYISVDRRGGRAVDEGFEAELRRHLERFRMAGHDLEIDGPRFVSLELELVACVADHYFQSDVKRALLEILGSGVLPDGTLGFFHPDQFTFGQPVLVSRIYAAAQRVAGVRHVQVTRLGRQHLASDEPAVPDNGVLSMNRLEIARLDHDPNFPDHGQLRIQTRGGR